ncbi:MAG: hypothetical protein LBV34_19955, partial [Nocardiopsaceae bacterium]|nr:hypothetical protein [Nocardiopsaceae bacterium]
GQVKFDLVRLDAKQPGALSGFVAGQVAGHGCHPLLDGRVQGMISRPHSGMRCRFAGLCHVRGGSRYVNLAEEML